MTGRRAVAAASLALFAAAVVIAAVELVRDFPRGPIAVVLVGGAGLAAWHAIRRRGRLQVVALVGSAVLLVGGVVVVLTGERIGLGLVATALLILGAVLAGRAFSVRVALPAAVRPVHPIVIWNPRSGGGKAVSNKLADEARARGIEPIELRPGDDLVELVVAAVERGADALGAAGGDGTQALVAAIAAEHDLPFACIPAGTRNHFALDLGVDRNDVVGALDAFVDGGERRIDLAEVNGRVFVNNVSLGLYAEAVQKAGYRDAKLRTILGVASDVLGPEAGGSSGALGWVDPDGSTQRSAAVILVSNNPYRLGKFASPGTRPTLDGGELGIAVLRTPQERPPSERGRRLSQQWAAPSFEVTAPQPVPIGVDGEALTLEAPLRFASRPGVLRVRIAAQHPGASPSVALPDGFPQMLKRLLEVAAGRK
jgi:diacylglycerol kinase family enzyme